jgi:membrane protein required for beta-lactamase induction
VNLLALLLGLAIERLVTSLMHLREPRWFDAYFDWSLAHAGAPRSGLIALAAVSYCLLPVLPVALVAALFGDRMFGLPYLVFATLVLMFSLGPRDLKDEVDDYCAAVERGDRDEAVRRATALLEDDASRHVGPIREALEEAVLVQSNHRIFGVIFWFMVLGPTGAWLFRVSDLMRRRAVFESRRAGNLAAGQSAFVRATQGVHRLLAWLPARVTALLFPLAGSFEDAVSGWREYLSRASEQILDASDQILVYVGMGALRSVSAPTAAADSDALVVNSAMRLVQRTLLLWLVVLAAFTLVGWLA